VVVQYQSQRNETYNRHLVEMQVRTVLQHAWSTAVETAGTFLGFNLKGGEGPPEWLEFFRLLSSEFATKEGTARVPNTPRQDECRARLRELSANLGVAQRLGAFSHALRILGDENANDARFHYYLLQLVSRGERVPLLKIKSYQRRQVEEANADYSKAEEESRANGGNWDVVLVSAQSMAALRNAYSNYFANTALFLNELEQIVSVPGAVQDPAAVPDAGEPPPWARNR
jgi:hypothetical protein